MGKNRHSAKEINSEPEAADKLLRQAERLRELEAENARLKSTVAMLTVDKLILEEVVQENV
jgi:hypothetical protein